MPPEDLNETKCWRDRAAGLRALADSYLDKKAAAILLRRADEYDKMAQLAADGAKRKIRSPNSTAPTRDQLQ
jgi:hypothetical protein